MHVLAATGVLAAGCAETPSEPVTPAMDAVFVGNTLPAQLEPRQFATVSVTVRNTGTDAWVTPGVRLGGAGTSATDPALRLLRGCDPRVVDPPLAQGVPLPEGTTVPPGVEHTFSFTIQAPDEEGTFAATWRLRDASGQTFGATSETRLAVVPAQYATNPFIVQLNQAAPTGNEGGGMVVADVDNDGRMDFVVGTRRNVGAYSHDGARLWVSGLGVYRAGEWKSLAGGKSPGVFVADVDGDEEQEVGYVTSGGALRILDGATGTEEKRIPVGEAQVALIANLRGLGDRDAVLQFDQTRLRAIRLDTGETLWTTSSFRGIEKRPARLADLDGDGKDEICGSNILGPTGEQIHTWDLVRDVPGFRWNDVDSVAIADIVPGGPLEVAIAEQGGHNEAIAFNAERIVYRRFNHDNRCCEVTLGKECIEIDPDKVALGDFAAGEGLEFFANSACGRAPWLMSSSGEIIASWIVDVTKPAGWTVHGIEDVSAIDWRGDGRHLLLAKERWLDDGDVAVIEPADGRFLERFAVAGVRVHAADVSGDYREEAVVFDLDGTLKVFWNPQPPAQVRPGYWLRQHYRRQKQNWNHYCP